MGVRKKASTYSLNEQFITECDLTYAVNMLAGRWKLQLLARLSKKTYRFHELSEAYPHITERMLSMQLKALEQDGLVIRTVYAEVPPRVEYTLTERAVELMPILDRLSAWGKKQRGK
ncbi:winged helix-turn-helix transcriptional regulator [Paraflavitalea pollutisoli]|uniref:winged helix-turn-helix transcriptional regulator n=1 Tax=Paraflavitalea pollutisoli TaxID=3034143 RepID=UPI0023ED03F8|nr:winged helix-turn-helix transcriptional regulator [Paraflavitalea sp. H1-2-19X]